VTQAVAAVVAGLQMTKKQQRKQPPGQVGTQLLMLPEGTPQQSSCQHCADCSSSHAQQTAPAHQNEAEPA
jgi:hypothetical protein